MMILIISGTQADEIKLTVSTRSVVSVGDRFQLTYTVNVNGGQFTGPQIKNFRTLSGPNIQTSQSYQVINGKMSQSISVSYVYYLQAFEEGAFEIPPASIEIEGEVIRSRPVSIEVVKGNARQGSDPSNTPGNNAANNPGEAGEMVSGDDVFLKAFVSNRNPYQGEQVIVSYKIYSAMVGISEIEFDNLASFPGFW